MAAFTYLAHKSQSVPEGNPQHVRSYVMDTRYDLTAYFRGAPDARVIHIHNEVPIEWMQKPATQDWAATGMTELKGTIYRHTETGRVVSTLKSGLWFPSLTRPRVAHDAMMFIGEVLAECSETDKTGGSLRLSATPSLTGVNLMQHTLHRGAYFAKLPAELEGIIAAGRGPAATPQTRFLNAPENWNVNRPLIINDFVRRYEYDLTAREMPTGHDVQLVEGGEFQPHRPFWYEIEGRVPNEWDHIGLAYVPAEPLGERWLNKPGASFRTWVSGAELFNLINNPVGQPWDFKIVRHIRFVSETFNPREKVFKGFIDLIRHVTNEASERRPELSEAVRYAMLRRVLHEGIGRLHRSPFTERTLSWEDAQKYIDTKSQEYVDRNIEQRSNDDDTMTLRERSNNNHYFPHIAATVWAGARAAIARRAMEVPYRSIVRIDQDAIWATTEIPSRNTNRGQTGFLRVKERWFGDEAASKVKGLEHGQA